MKKIPIYIRLYIYLLSILLSSTIYTVHAGPVQKPPINPRVIIKGKITDRITRQPLAATVRIIDKTYNQSVIVNSDRFGCYIAVTYPKKNISRYNIKVSKSGYRTSETAIYVRMGYTYRVNFPLFKNSYFLIKTPPVIEITTPQNNSYTNRTSITVIGTINKDAVVTVNGIIASVSDKRFTANNVPLRNEGANTITVTARDAIGNLGTKTITVTRDTIPPQNPSILIQQGDYTNNPNITLNLSAEGASEVAISETRQFQNPMWMAYTATKSFTLSSGDGSKTVYIKYRDLAGNETLPVSDLIILDTIPPQIEITFPENNHTANQIRVDISGTFAEINLDTITVNGIPAVIEGNNFTVQNVQLNNEEDNSIIASINDFAGNNNTHQINIIRDTISPSEPTINTVTSPTNRLSQRISGTKTVDTELIVVECATAVISGIHYPTDTAWESDITGMAEGENIITVTAHDRAGNSSNSVYANIMVDITPPEISITSPSDGTVFRHSLIDVEGTVDDYEAEVTVNNTSVRIVAGIFKVEDVPLLEGNNNIIVRAVDRASNISTAQIIVNYNTTPITLPWPMYRHDPRGTSRSEYTATDINRLKWEITNLSARHISLSSDFIYVKSNVWNSNWLYKVDYMGNIKWKSSIKCTYGPTVVTVSSAGYIYLNPSNSYDSSNEKVLSCLDEEDGSLVWEFILSPPVGYKVFKINPSEIILSTDGKIYFTSHSRFQDINNQWSERDQLFCINQDGTLAWIYDYNSHFYNMFTPVVDSNGNIYTLRRNGVLTAIDRSGNLKWGYNTGQTISYPFGTNVSALAVGNNGTIYVGTDCLYAISPEGNLLWKYQTGSQIRKPISISLVNGQESIYVISGANDNTLYSLDLNGNLNWAYQSDGRINPISIDSAGSLFFIIHKSGRSQETEELISLNSNGTVRWVFPLDSMGNGENGIAIGSDGTLFFANNSGYIYAIGKDDIPPKINGPSTMPYDCFSPNSDGQKDTIEINALINEFVNWVFTIKDNLGETVKQFSGSGSGYVKAIWDGANEVGENLPDGEYRIQVAANDLSNNQSKSDEVSVFIDITSPLNPSISTEDATANSSFIDLIVSAESARYVRVSEDQQLENIQWCDLQSPMPFTLSRLDGEKIIYAQFSDAAGNKTDVISTRIILNQPLDKNSVSVSIEEGEYTNERDITLLLEAIGANSIILSEQPQFIGSIWQDFNQQIGFSLSPGEGRKTVYIKFRDTYTGEESELYSISITYNIDTPANPQISIREGDIAYHSTVHLKLHVEDAVEMILSENRNFTGAVWESYKGEQSFVLSKGNGPKTIYVKYRNRIGNQTQPASASTILDIPFLLIDPGENSSKYFQEQLQYQKYDFEVWKVDELGFPSAEIMNRYDLVFLSTFTNIYPQIDFHALSDFLDNKGCLYLSSQYLLEMPDASNFVEQYLGITGHRWRILFNILTLTGLPGDPITDNTEFYLTYNNVRRLSPISVNELTITPLIKTILQDDKGQSYAIRYPLDNRADSYRLVFFAFWGEDIGIQDIGVLTKAIDWLVKELGISDIDIKDNESNISLRSNILIKFTTNLDRDTINNNTIQISSDGRGLLNGVLTYQEDTRVVKFDPDQDFFFDENITIKITTELQNIFGAQFKEDYLYTFNLSHFMESLRVVETNPSLNAINAFLSTSIQVKFNNQLDPETITTESVIVNGSLSGTISGDIIYDRNSNILTFNPNREFLTQEVITVTLTSIICDIYGVGFSGGDNYIWSFNTGAQMDTIAPQINITSVSPLYFSNLYLEGPWWWWLAPGYGWYPTRTETEILANISEQCFWVVSIIDINNQVVKRYESIGTTVLVIWDGKDGAGNRVSEGIYSYTITARDLSGNETVSPAGTIVIDNTPPQNTSVSIVEQSPIREPTIHINLNYGDDIDSVKILNQSMYYHYFLGLQDLDIVFSEGWESVSSQKIFTFVNPYEGSNGVVYIFKDKAGNIVMGREGILLDYLPQILGVSVFPFEISPNGDDIAEGAYISVTANVPLNWNLSIRNNLGQLVRSCNTTNYAVKNLNFTWDGRDNGGHLLPSGIYNCIINGRDEQGNAINELTQSITIHLKPPEGASISILEVPITNSPNITLEAHANNASQMRLSESMSFSDTNWIEYSEHTSFTMSNGDGIKTVYAQFMDSAGNITQPVSASITLDTTPPPIPAINPVTSPTDNPKQIISGVKSEDTVQVNIYGPVQVENLTHPTTTTWRADITLQEGFNDISVTAVDGVGNISPAAEKTIYYSWNIEKPAVQITSPQDGAIVNNGTMTGRVSDLAAMVQINGIPTGVNEQGIFSIELELIEGENTITAIVTDRDSDTGTAIIRVIYDTTNPGIRITSPPNGAIADITPVIITGIVNDANLSEVSVNLIPAIVTEGQFTAEGIELEQGENTITAVAIDKAGNNSEASITITLDNNAPKYSIEEVYGSTIEMDPAQYPEAGSQHELKVKLYINGEPAQGQIIQFQITEGNGMLSQAQVMTDSEGEASTLLTLDTNTEHINKIIAYPAQCPQGKVEFIVLGRAGSSAVITRLTDETLTYIPGAEIELIVKVTDQHNNPIEDQQINFAVLSGGGELQQETATTNEIGEAWVGYIVGPTAGVVNTIRAELSNNPTVNTIFNIQTIALPPGITVENIINRVNENDSRIQDVQADMVITTNTPWADPETRLRIWQKGNKQKTHETYPENNIHIRPQGNYTVSSTIQWNQSIIAYEQDLNEYVLKVGYNNTLESEIYYKILFVDYSKGVVAKEITCRKDGSGITYVTLLMENYVQDNNVWLYNRKIERFLTSFSGETYITITEIMNREINTGISDGEFE